MIIASKMSAQTSIENLSLFEDSSCLVIAQPMLFYHMALSRHTITSIEVAPLLTGMQRAKQERQGERMMTTTSLLQQSRTSNAAWDVSSSSTHEVRQWCQIIALPLVGMLLLLLCFLLQGVFAEIGPWVIFVGVKLITKKLEQQQSCRVKRPEVVSYQLLVGTIGTPLVGARSEAGNGTAGYCA
jgi:hypothetical protein